jgi:hypothetical protein
VNGSKKLSKRTLQKRAVGQRDGTIGLQGFHIVVFEHPIMDRRCGKRYQRPREQIEAFADSLAPGWTPENVIWETTLREGYSLTSRIEKIPNTGKQNFWRVTDSERDQSFVICVDATLTLEAVRGLKLKKDSLFVCRDAALDDTLSANLALQCRLKVL